MSSYEYLTVFLSVIFGLAVVHLLSGLSLILDSRKVSRPYWVHLVWVQNVFVLAVATWWMNFSLAEIRDWSFFHYTTLVGYAVLIYGLAGLLFPTRGPEVVEFRTHFEQNRKWFFLVLAAFFPVDVLNAWFAQTAGPGGGLSPGYVTFAGGSFLGSLAAAHLKTGPFHGLFGLAWLGALLAWVVLEYGGIPGAGGG